MFYKKDKNQLEAYIKRSFLLMDYSLSLDILEKQKNFKISLKYKDLSINQFNFLKTRLNIYKSSIKLVHPQDVMTKFLFFNKKNKTLFFSIRELKQFPTKFYFKTFLTTLLLKYNNFYLNYIKQKESRKLS
jgi:hypothetical protein